MTSLAAALAAALSDHSQSDHPLASKRMRPRPVARAVGPRVPGSLPTPLLSTFESPDSILSPCDDLIWETLTSASNTPAIGLSDSSDAAMLLAFEMQGWGDDQDAMMAFGQRSRTTSGSTVMSEMSVTASSVVSPRKLASNLHVVTSNGRPCDLEVKSVFDGSLSFDPRPLVHAQQPEPLPQHPHDAYSPPWDCPCCPHPSYYAPPPPVPQSYASCPYPCCYPIMPGGGSPEPRSPVYPEHHQQQAFPFQPPSEPQSPIYDHNQEPAFPFHASEPNSPVYERGYSNQPAAFPFHSPPQQHNHLRPSSTGFPFHPPPQPPPLDFHDYRANAGAPLSAFFELMSGNPVAQETDGTDPEVEQHHQQQRQHEEQAQEPATPPATNEATPSPSTPTPSSTSTSSATASTAPANTSTAPLAPAKRTFACPHPGCGRTFPRQYNLRSHVLCHTGQRDHACGSCGAKFARKHDLQRHLRTLHAEDRPYRCPKCDLGFTRPDQLARHRTLEERALLARAGAAGRLA